MPGTTWNGMPCAARVSISSPPRPKMNGSPPLRRSTRLPSLARRTSSSLISSWRIVWSARFLPTKMRCASRRAMSTMGFDTRLSYTTTSAFCIRRSARKVSRSGSPGPAPTRYTSPRRMLSSSSSICCSIASALPSSPVSTFSATTPSNTFSQKMRRLAGLVTRCLTASRKRSANAARRLKFCGMKVSSLPRSRRVSTGEAPPLENATINGERSRTAGMTKLHSSGSSTTFTGMLRARASSETCRLTLRSSVAAMTSITPSRCCASKRAAMISTPCCPTSAGSICGATTRTRAPASSKTPALRRATSPPPATRHSLPLTFRKTGRKSMLLHRLQDQRGQRFRQPDVAGEHELMRARRHLLPSLADDLEPLFLVVLRVLGGESGDVMLVEHQVRHVFHQLRLRVYLQPLLADDARDAGDHRVVITRLPHDAPGGLGVESVQPGAPLQIALPIHRIVAARYLPALDMLRAYRTLHCLRCLGRIAFLHCAHALCIEQFLGIFLAIGDLGVRVFRVGLVEGGDGCVKTFLGHVACWVEWAASECLCCSNWRMTNATKRG